MNEAGWCMLEESGRPVQVSRNCITYTLPGEEPGKISLVDTHSNYIAAVVEVEADDKALAVRTCEKLCPVVRDTVYRNIRKAVAALNYTNTIPSYGFLCPSISCSTSSHAAIINSDHTAVTCVNKRSVIHPMTECQKMWLSGLTPAKTTAATAGQSSSGIC